MSQRGIHIFNDNGQWSLNDPEREKDKDQRVGLDFDLYSQTLVMDNLGITALFNASGLPNT